MGWSLFNRSCAGAATLCGGEIAKIVDENPMPKIDSNFLSFLEDFSRAWMHKLEF